MADEGDSSLVLEITRVIQETDFNRKLVLSNLKAFLEAFGKLLQTDPSLIDPRAFQESIGLAPPSRSLDDPITDLIDLCRDGTALSGKLEEVCRTHQLKTVRGLLDYLAKHSFRGWNGFGGKSILKIQQVVEEFGGELILSNKDRQLVKIYETAKNAKQAKKQKQEQERLKW